MQLVRLQTRLRPVRGAPRRHETKGATRIAQETPRDAVTAMTATITSDQQVRDRIRDDLDTTLVIEAAAGTGKTTALVNRIVSVIGSGRGELGRIVAVAVPRKPPRQRNLPPPQRNR